MAGIANYIMVFLPDEFVSISGGVVEIGTWSPLYIQCPQDWLPCWNLSKCSLLLIETPPIHTIFWPFIILIGHLSVFSGLIALMVLLWTLYWKAISSSHGHLRAPNRSINHIPLNKRYVALPVSSFYFRPFKDQAVPNIPLFIRTVSSAWKMSKWKWKVNCEKWNVMAPECNFLQFWGN